MGAQIIVISPMKEVEALLSRHENKSLSGRLLRRAFMIRKTSSTILPIAKDLQAIELREKLLRVV